MTHDVYFKSASYDYALLKPLVYEMLDATAGDRIRRGARVLIKPNLLRPAGPDTAVLTHPLVVKAVAEYALERGARPVVADSPAVGSFRRAMKTGGFARALEGLDVACREFGETVKKDIGEPFGRVDLARDVVEADAVINLAKLKTHNQMLLTLGVKNLFGCIVGIQKPEWHLRAGVDQELFARLLVQIHYAVDPAATIIDGVLAMEGQGPGSGGTPRPLGVLIGGRDAAAADAAVCRMLKLDPEKLPTHQAARRLGKIEARPVIHGEFRRVDDFIFPDLGPSDFGSSFLRGFTRNYMIQKPVVDPDRCRTCGECWQYCPARAITESGDAIQFDYERCIRCYCCVEVCPHGALEARRPVLGKLLNSLGILK
ncbi:MAG: DUF362 domain-containing protein [Desulfobacterales bacterium]|nr:DUF362 domain-containing protein [Desulfobacterales bacterium]